MKITVSRNFELGGKRIEEAVTAESPMPLDLKEFALLVEQSFVLLRREHSIAEEIP